MKDKDKKWINQRYSTRIKEENYSYEAMRTGPKSRREIRFRNLLEVGIRSGDSVMDLGCGYGDLVNFFESNSLKVDYSGFDINLDFIEEAKKRHPKKKIKLVDVVNDDYQNFDWIVSTSSFNLKLNAQDNYQFCEQLLGSIYSHSKKGVAIDFLSDYVDFKNEIGFHYSPEKVFSIAKKFTKRVKLKHDYRLFEFCNYMYPDFKGWAKNQ